METSLHRQLKLLYGSRQCRFEVQMGPYRIDVVRPDQLVEIQHGSLAAIRAKVEKLLESHRVLVVKPIVASKLLVKQAAKGGRVISRRMSPKRGQILDLFDELVYFTRVFPHRRLTLDVPLVDIEEWRYPGHGRRRRWRPNDHQVEDQRLLAIRRLYRLRTAADVGGLVCCRLPSPFDTRQLARALCIERWFSQRIAYCLRKIGALREVGKKGNCRLYEFVDDGPARSACQEGKSLIRAA